MLTVDDVLRMAPLRSADPVVVAGHNHLDRPVRWVHSTELVDIGPLLRGGDLVLTTGIALPGTEEALTSFVTGLVESGVAGLLVELGRRWTELPDALATACEERDLPLVALRREARFASITQAVGERLVDEQLTELRDAERVHDVFTELSIAEAGPDEILAEVQRLAGTAVVLESEQHHVLDYRSGPEDVADFLADWERRSQNVPATGRTTWDESNGWLLTRVGRRERGWGRLVIGSPTRPSQRLVAVAERAAAALAMHRLHDRTRDSQVRRLHQEVLLGLLADPSDPETHRKAAVTGVPLHDRRLVGIELRPAAGPSGAVTVAPTRVDDLVAACLRAADRTGLPALVTAHEDGVRVLLPVPPRDRPDRAADRFVEEVRSGTANVAAAGSSVTALAQADRTLREAAQVLSAVPEAAEPTGVVRLEDVHVRGLLTLLADDDRVRDFARRELAPLREADSRGELERTLRAVLQHWESKSAAAAALNMSRPVLYERMARIERILSVELRDAEARASLHVALIADELTGRAGR